MGTGVIKRGQVDSRGRGPRIVYRYHETAERDVNDGKTSCRALKLLTRDEVRRTSPPKFAARLSHVWRCFVGGRP